MVVFKNFDYGGLILFSGSMVSLLLGLSWGGSQYGKFSGLCVSSAIH